MTVKTDILRRSGSSGMPIAVIFYQDMKVRASSGASMGEGERVLVRANTSMSRLPTVLYFVE